MSQKEAVFTAVTNVVGSFDGACTPTKEQRASINQVLCEGFKSGKIALDREFSDSDLKQYVSGLISNWLRKDTRLNGGEKYAAKNPGSRAGSTDPQLKAMRALLTTVSSSEEKAEIQGYIDARVSEIAKTKQVKVVDFSALPADLQAKFNK